MFRAVVLDDKPDQARALVTLLRASARGDVLDVECFVAASDLRSYVQRNGRPDIAFIDTCLTESGLLADGVAAVKELFPDHCGTQVVYVTEHVEHCVSVYQTQHVYLLVKPVDLDSLDAALGKAFDNLKVQHGRMLPITSAGRVVGVSARAIQYAQSDRRKIRIHTEEGEVETYMTLASLLAMLPASFIQCHKSYVLNLAAVREIDPTGATLVSGCQVPISRQRRSAVRDAYVQYLQERLGGGGSFLKASLPQLGYSRRRRISGRARLTALLLLVAVAGLTVCAIALAFKVARPMGDAAVGQSGAGGTEVL